MKRSQYKTTIYDIDGKHYGTITEFSNLEPEAYQADVDNMIRSGRWGRYANTASVCRLSFVQVTVETEEQLHFDAMEAVVS